MISSDFRLLDFNERVRERYPGIKQGDLCYQATMMRDTACMHCPIAGHCQTDEVTVFDPFYGDWIHAVFAEVGDGRYAVTCRGAQESARTTFQRLRVDSLSSADDLLREYDDDRIGMLGGYCEEGLPLRYVNDRMIEMLGYKDRADFVRGIEGKVINTIHPEDLQKVLADLGGHYYAGMKYELSYRMVRKDGSWLMVVDRGEVIEEAHGRLIILCVCLDVTEEYRRREAKALESIASASKERILTDIVHAQYSYSATVNLITGKFRLTSNQGMDEFTRQILQTDDYVEACRMLSATVQPEYADELHRRFSLAELRRRRDQQGHIGQLEYAGKTSKGIGWFEVDVFIGMDDDGTPIASIFGRDVTEAHWTRERRERELRAVAARDQLLSDITKMLYGYTLTVAINTGRYTLIPGHGMEDTVAFLAAHDRYEEVYAIFCRNTDEAQRARAAELLSLDNYRGRTGRAGIVGREDFLEHLPDGSTAWQEMNVIVGFDRDGEPMLHILGRDVTEIHDRANTKAQLEIAKAASAAKTSFLFNMSHDIRTPMNAIIGFTELLEKHLDNRALTLEYIGKIKTANEFLLSLINNVLEMARIESGKVNLDETVCNMHEFWNTIQDLLGDRMRQKQITYVCRIQAAHPDVCIDKTKYREIILNLLSNACKYTPSGGRVTVTVTELPSDRPGYATFRTVIEDTGIGMSRVFLPHIFDAFTREHTSTESRVIGTGLGMPIVKKLVDLMQGSIDVESELGKGTRFTLIIPHRIAEEREPLRTGPLTEDCRIADFAGKRILLAEDNELNAEIAITLLTEEGFLVEHAADGVICVDMLERAPSDYYSLVLMDIQMPHMDGYKATQIIRRLPDRQKASLPIVAMTANAFEEDRRKAFRMGMNAHIVKPIQMDILRNTLGYVLSDREEDKDVYARWHEYFQECVPFRQFVDQYRHIGDIFGCFVYETTGDERLCYADEQVIRIFGCRTYMELYQHAGGSFRAMVHPADIERAEAEIAGAAGSDPCSTTRVQYRIRRKDGQVRYIDDIGRQVCAGNGRTVCFACMVDVTDEIAP